MRCFNFLEVLISYKKIFVNMPRVTAVTEEVWAAGLRSNGNGVGVYGGCKSGKFI